MTYFRWAGVTVRTVNFRSDRPTSNPLVSDSKESSIDLLYIASIRLISFLQALTALAHPGFGSRHSTTPILR